jgi:hypothetical protein
MYPRLAFLSAAAFPFEADELAAGQEVLAAAVTDKPGVARRTNHLAAATSDRWAAGTENCRCEPVYPG